MDKYFREMGLGRGLSAFPIGTVKWWFAQRATRCRQQPAHLVTAFGEGLRAIGDGGSRITP